AQYYPQQQGYGQGNGYGQNANYGQARSLIARVDQIQRQIDRLDRRDRLSNREANRLRYEAQIVRNQVRRASFNGLGFRERQALEYRVARLEQRVRKEANDGNRWGNNDRRWQDQYGRYDRDRDGRDDRYEDDRGTRHD
ncbi:MAG TPA: hypothetical protein VK485_04165, partial [Sphingomicrobium sp.]|nr:hypothetical protein [Sphingomicrobium sp.]